MPHNGELLEHGKSSAGKITSLLEGHGTPANPNSLDNATTNTGDGASACHHSVGDETFVNH